MFEKSTNQNHYMWFSDSDVTSKMFSGYIQSIWVSVGSVGDNIDMLKITTMKYKQLSLF